MNNCTNCGWSYAPYKAEDWSWGTGEICIVPVRDKEPKGLCPYCNKNSQLYNEKHYQLKEKYVTTQKRLFTKEYK